jgi:SAM-dependent methyltransferase
MENRICPITNTDKFEEYYSSHNGKIMTSDQRTISGDLNKIIFTESGVVANKNSLDPSEIELLYGEEYQLNTSGQDEHVFYTEKGSISRSQVYYNWIKPFLSTNWETCVEIGCGEGRVLEKISTDFPNRNIIGFDGNHKAAESGRKRGFNITQKIFQNKDEFPRADIFLLIGVLEHVEDPARFIKLLISSLNSYGRLILSIPIQDYGGYDIFFKDHIWHFTVKQFQALLNSCGLKLLHTDFDNPINHGFGLFVCEKGEGVEPNLNVSNETTIQKNNLDFWLDKFINVENLKLEQSSKKIAVFGASELFTLFYTYSSLANTNILACIDDSKHGTTKHGIQVFNSEWLNDNEIDVLILAINKKYHPMVKNKLSHLPIEMISLY